tara:strand:+ start:1707 stop:3587 length:1881 start_codon:yes stop_codon:yes gene_type:complete
MFRDLKEYQQIQKIYEESVKSKFLTEEEEDVIIAHLFEENWTHEQFVQLAEDIEQGGSLNERAAILKTIAKTPIGKSVLKNIGKGFKATKGFIGKLKGAKPLTVTKTSKNLIDPKGNPLSYTKDLNPVKNIKTPDVGKIKTKVVDTSKKVVDDASKKAKKIRSKFDRKVTTTSKTLKGVDGLPLKTTKTVNPINKRNVAIGTLVGAGIVANNASKDDKKKETTSTLPPETTKVDTTPTPTPTPTVSFKDSIKNAEALNKDTTTTKKEVEPNVSTKDTPKSTVITKTEKKKRLTAREKMEARNRRLHGDKAIDALKKKNAAFQKARKKGGDYTMDDFVKDFPNSNTAKERAKRNRIPSVMDMESFNPNYDHATATGLAEAYQKMYSNPESVVIDEEARNELVDYLISEGTFTTPEEANQYINDLNPEELQEVLGAIKKLGSNVKSAVSGAVDKGKSLVQSGINKAKETAGNVKTAVSNQITKRKEQISDVKSGGVDQLKKGNQLRSDIAQKKETLKTQQSSGGSDTGSGMSNDPGKTKAQLLALKNKRQKMNNPEAFKKKQAMTGAERAKEMARARLAAKNESVEKDAYSVVLEYLLGQKHADTIEEANYIMTELDTETIQSIISES